MSRIGMAAIAAVLLALPAGAQGTDAEAWAKLKSATEARLMAEAAAHRKASGETMVAQTTAPAADPEAEKKRLADEEAAFQANYAALLKAEEEAAAKKKAEADAKAKADAEIKAAAEAKRLAEEEAAFKANFEALQKAEEAAAAKKKAEADAMAKVEAEAKAKANAEAEAKAKAEAAAAVLTQKMRAELERMAAAQTAAPAATAASDTTSADACVARMRDLASANAIQFSSGSTTIAAASMATVKEIAKVAQSCPGVALVVEGHTDATGSEPDNMALSQSRAQAVVEALASAGVAKSRLNAKGYGETKPLETNATSEGRARNRRIEFAVGKI